MNTFNEFELNRIKRLYADELASRLQRSKSTRLSGQHQQHPEHYHYRQRRSRATNESQSAERLVGRQFPRQMAHELETAVAMASPRSQGIDLKRYEHALQTKKATPGNYRRSRSASGGAPQASQQPTSGARGKFGRALFDFQAKTDRELSLRKEDLVEMLELLEESPAWVRVEDCQSGLTGLVPMSYIDFSVGCAVARRDVHASGDQRPTTCALANAPSTSGSRRSAPLLPMSKGEPITLLRRLSGHWYEATNTKQVKGLVWSNDLDIIKQPTGEEIPAPTKEQYSYPTRGNPNQDDDFTDNDNDDDEDNELLIMDSHGDPRALTMRRARSCSGCAEPNELGQAEGCDCSARGGQHGQHACCYRKTSRASHSFVASGRGANPSQQVTYAQRQASDESSNQIGQAPRRSSSSPYISAAGAATMRNDGHLLPRLCRAKFAYKPRQKDELELVPGGVLVVVHECDDGWFIGSSYSTNQMGTFPGNFVESI